MIRQSTKTVKTTIDTDNDRFVTPTITFDKTSPSKSVGIMIPTLDDDSAVKLEIAPREHRFNYPCLDEKAKPEGAGYEDNGILFEWDMDDADGTTITDRVNGLVLTEQGDPTFQASATTPGLGNGLTFDGTADAFDVAFANAAAAVPYSLIETGDFSVEIVFKTTDTTSGAGDTLVCCRDGADGVGWQLEFDDADHVDFHIEDSSGQTVLTGTTDVDTGNIVHIIVSLDRSGNGIIYVNGAAEGSASITARALTLLNESADTRFAIGGDAARTAGDCFTGTVYFVRVYNKALSATEALENYRIMMNQGYPGWVPLADPADGDDLSISASASDPNYFDLTEYLTLKKVAMRAVCSVEQTTTPVDLDFVWLFE